MNKFFITMTILIGLFILSAQSLYAETVQKPTEIPTKGETVIIAKSEKMKIRMKIITREVQIGKSSDERPPDSICSSWGYVTYPRSVVSNIEISVDDKLLFVPPSIICGLTELTTAEIKITHKKALLTLEGGDASESYIVKIEFDGERVMRKSLWSGEFPEKPTEETIYHEQIIENE